MNASDPGRMTIDDRLFEAARNGAVDTLATLLDEHPDKLYARAQPYGWSLLHLAAHGGHLSTVDLLLNRGLDVNIREKGDNTYPLHWAAAAGHQDVVRRLVEAGGDIVGHGDDHELEVIGWASCWNGCDDAIHRAVVDYLVAHGAQHHIFSAIALNLADQVRRIVSADPSALARKMSHNEGHQLPLHFAVRMNRPQMVALLMELGADPLATDGSGYRAAAYATTPDIDRPAMEAIRARGLQDLLTALVLGDWDAAALLLRDSPDALAAGGASFGTLHLMSKRGNVAAVKWLLDHAADPSARWSHWDAEVTPLHLAVLGAHPEVVRSLLQAGADPRVRDSKHDSDAIGWAEFFQRLEIVRIIRASA